MLVLTIFLLVNEAICEKIISRNKKAYELLAGRKVELYRLIDANLGTGVGKGIISKGSTIFYVDLEKEFQVKNVEIYKYYSQKTRDFSFKVVAMNTEPKFDTILEKEKCVSLSGKDANWKKVGSRYGVMNLTCIENGRYIVILATNLETYSRYIFLREMKVFGIPPPPPPSPKSKFVMIKSFLLACNSSFIQQDTPQKIVNQWTARRITIK